MYSYFLLVGFLRGRSHIKEYDRSFIFSRRNILLFEKGCMQISIKFMGTIGKIFVVVGI